MSFKSLIKILITFSLVVPTGPLFAADLATPEGEEAKCTTCSKDIKTCEGKLKAAAVGESRLATEVDEGGHSSTGTLDGGSKMAGHCAATQKFMKEAEPACQCAVAKCKPEELKAAGKSQSDLEGLLEQAKAGGEGSSTCEAGGNKVADETRDSDEGGKKKGGGMDPMMAGLLGAGAGALLMYMMNKKKEDKEEDAIVGDGTVDCSKPDGYTYADCDDYLTQFCTNELNSGSAATEGCSQFAGRYCNMNGKGITADTPTTVESDNASVGVTLGGNGKGITTSYCKLAVAKDFCDKQTVASKPSCPSCIMLDNAKTAACAANPTMCLPQHSLSDIEQAKVTCMGDPAFSDPVYAAGGGAAVPTQLAAEGLPSVVLPTGQAATTGSGNTTTTGDSGTAVVLPGSASGLSTASANSATGNSATREGMSTASASAATAAAAGAYGGSRTGGFSDRIAGAGSAAGGRSPASDVGGQFGSNLFKISAEAIGNSCAASRSHCRSDQSFR